MGGDLDTVDSANATIEVARAAVELDFWCNEIFGWETNKGSIEPHEAADKRGHRLAYRALRHAKEVRSLSLRCRIVYNIKEDKGFYFIRLISRPFDVRVSSELRYQILEFVYCNTEDLEEPSVRPR